MWYVGVADETYVIMFGEISKSDFPSFSFAINFCVFFCSFCLVFTSLSFIVKRSTMSVNKFDHVFPDEWVGSTQNVTDLWKLFVLFFLSSLVSFYVFFLYFCTLSTAVSNTQSQIQDNNINANTTPVTYWHVIKIYHIILTLE